MNASYEINATGRFQDFQMLYSFLGLPGFVWETSFLSPPVEALSSVHA